MGWLVIVGAGFVLLLLFYVLLVVIESMKPKQEIKERMDWYTKR